MRSDTHDARVMQLLRRHSAVKLAGMVAELERGLLLIRAEVERVDGGADPGLLDVIDTVERIAGSLTSGAGQ